MTRTSLMIRLAPWLFTIGLFVIWELAVRIFQIPEFFLPPPTAIARAFYDYWPAIVRNSRITLEATVIGFAIRPLKAQSASAVEAASDSAAITASFMAEAYILSPPRGRQGVRRPPRSRRSAVTSGRWHRPSMRSRDRRASIRSCRSRARDSARDRGQAPSSCRPRRVPTSAPCPWRTSISRGHAATARSRS